MAVSGLSGIESMLQQMRAVVHAAQNNGASVSDLAPAHTSFAAELHRSVQRISATQTAASNQAKAYELGAPDISLNNVMIDLQKSAIAFQTAVQVRNRLVAAYKEISSMAV
ncbi:flagellar hook-basal body complex protein FliE [Bordetella sp. BOR01]|uniref:flagellar hook-basal body complex protein FliE n=1 Tax=Bordetella sp. BOR01 TaxID=2854779 RepID=UPI001C45AD1B|nr:flagellar hook-basal body complex protein FliE [Bordetella sp. BOR01]MBV7486316.1 flagellar hook-basal body complex protein FliE [Bordetella sp. BOR01]